MWQSFWDAIEKLFQQDTAAIAGQFDAVALSDLSKLAQGLLFASVLRGQNNNLMSNGWANQLISYRWATDKEVEKPRSWSPTL